MDKKILGNFVKMEVEILVAGQWIPGFMAPIVNTVITLLPNDDTKDRYGPTAIEVDQVQAIRQVRRGQTASVAPNVAQPVLPTAAPVRSALESTSTHGGQHPGAKYVHR